MGNYLLGIDIGTSACKTTLFDVSGNIIANTTEEYPVFRPKPGWVEQNADDWWNAACKAVKSMLMQSGVNPSDIEGVGIDGQGWSAIPIDSDGIVLGNTPIWLDTRAGDICDELDVNIGAQSIFELCGNPLSPSYTQPKVQWFRRYMPELYSRVYKILQSNSYIAFRFTGEITQDISQGYGYFFFDMRKGKYDEAMAREMGMDVSLLPPIVSCSTVIGKVTAEAAVQSGLCEGTPVVAGGLDAACGTLGAGVIKPGQTQEQGGQAGGMSICLDQYHTDPRLIMGFHVVPDKWLLQGGTVGGGGTVKWLKESVFPDLSLKQMDMLAETVPPGSDGLIFLPYMSGERSPVWNANAKGVFYGLDYAKTRAHIVRAVMEGVAFSLRHNIETAENAGAELATLNSIGGSSNSLVWTQLKSDVTAKQFAVPSSDTATTLGAAILAGIGVGVWPDFDDAISQTVKITREHTPNYQNFEVYDRQYKCYLQIYESLRSVMGDRIP